MSINLSVCAQQKDGGAAGKAVNQKIQFASELINPFDSDHTVKPSGEVRRPPLRSDFDSQLVAPAAHVAAMVNFKTPLDVRAAR